MTYKLQEVALMQVKQSEISENWGRFIIEPLSPGFGLTVGNALRRVLLSSLEGAAITSVRIDGVAHEFSTIKGVHQDVVDIILNLKKVRVKLEGNDSQVIVLDAKKTGVVKAGDFKCPTGVEIINKDFPICELAENGRILLEATVETGKGYVPTEARKEDKLPIGVIAIDAAYSPIEKVNFQIENTRVGKMTNFDRLVLEIGTDGTISPEEALKISSSVLVDHFNVISGINNHNQIEEAIISEEPENHEADSTKPTKTKKKTKKSE